MEEPKPSPTVFRLFIAITVPEAIRAEMASAQAELRRAVGNARISWTRPEQFHLTLRFLGNVGATSIEALGNALKEACNGFDSLSIRARGLGCFPNLRRPRVIWAGLPDTAQCLGRMQRAIQEATRRFTAEPAEKGFSGHITLGRIKEMNALERRAFSTELTRMARTELGEWTASRVELIRSELSEQGARYTQLLEVGLEK